MSENAEPEIDTEEPTIKGNLEKTASIGLQLADMAATSAINNAARAVNVDPNASTDEIMKQINDKFTKINKAFQSPEGKQMLTELGSLASTLALSTQEPLKEGQRIFNNILEDQLRTFRSLTWNAIGLIPVIGEVSEIVRIANDLTTAFLKNLKAFTGVTVKASDTVEKLRGAVDQQSNLFVRMAGLVKKAISEGNRDVEKYLTKASEDLKEQSKMLSEETEKLSKKEKKGGFSKIRKGGAKVTKRVHRSIRKFMSSKVTSSHIRRKYSKKRKSRRHRK